MIDKAAFLEGNFNKASFLANFATDIQKAVPVDGAYLLALEKSGGFTRIGPSNEVSFNQIGADAPDKPNIRDVCQAGDLFFLAHDKGVSVYSFSERSFIATGDLRARELRHFDGSLHVLTENGQLLKLKNGKSRSLAGGYALQIDDDLLSDVRCQGDRIYLAGGGLAQMYDGNRRNVLGTWRLPSRHSQTAKNKVEIVDIVDGVPLMQCGREAFYGNMKLGKDGGEVRSAFYFDNRFWTFREAPDGKRAYLEGYSKNGDKSQCLFRRPTVEGRILDAKRVGNGLVVAATENGDRFYFPRYRTWAKGPFPTIHNEVFSIGDHVVLLKRDLEDFRADIATTNELVLADGAAERIPPFRPGERNSIAGKSVAINETTLSMAWMDKDMSIWQWEPEKFVPLLQPSEGKGPLSRNIRSIYDFKDTLFGSLFAITGESVFRYDLSRAWWHELKPEKETFAFDGEGTQRQIFEPVEDIEYIAIQKSEDATGLDDDTLFFTVKQKTSEQYWVGRLAPGDDRLIVREAFAPQKKTLDAPPRDLLDVQISSNSMWSFFLKDRVKYFDPVTREWKQDAAISGPSECMTLARAVGLEVAEDCDGRYWWIEQGDGFTPSSFARYDRDGALSSAIDGDGRVWRLEKNQELKRCQAQNGRYSKCDTRFQPVSLNPDHVSNAYRWRFGTSELFVFTTQEGPFLDFRSSSVSTRKTGQQDLPENCSPFFSDIDQIRQKDNDLFVKNRNGLLVLSTDMGSELEFHAFSDASAFLMDKDQTPWAEFSDGWKHWRGGFSTLLLDTGDGVMAKAQAAFVAENAPASAMATDRTIYYRGKSLWEKIAMLPEDMDHKSIVTIVRISDSRFAAIEKKRRNRPHDRFRHRWPKNLLQMESFLHRKRQRRRGHFRRGHRIGRRFDSVGENRRVRFAYRDQGPPYRAASRFHRELCRRGEATRLPRPRPGPSLFPGRQQERAFENVREPKRRQSIFRSRNRFLHGPRRNAFGRNVGGGHPSPFARNDFDRAGKFLERRLARF